MRVAVDSLGGDNAPEEIVAGTLSVARQSPNDVFVLVGDETVSQKADQLSYQSRESLKRHQLDEVWKAKRAT